MFQRSAGLAEGPSHRSCWTGPQTMTDHKGGSGDGKTRLVHLVLGVFLPVTGSSAIPLDSPWIGRRRPRAGSE
jgi:hypothetical protein